MLYSLDIESSVSHITLQKSSEKIVSQISYTSHYRNTKFVKIHSPLAFVHPPKRYLLLNY